jgi:tyrosine-protein kinase Etk/Wzc
VKNDRTPIAESPLYQAPKKDPHILDFFTLLARYRWLVIALTFGCGVAFLGSTYLMRHYYTSMATLLPPEKQAMGGLMSFLTGSGALDLMKGAENPATDMFKNILDSRALTETIAKDKRVRGYFSTFDTSELAIRGMTAGSMTAEPLRNGLMTVTIELPTHFMPDQKEQDSAKVMSAYLANLYVTELDRYNRERLMTTAKNTRIFVEGEYRNRMHQLDSMYALLQEFQEKHKTISLTDQLQATVTSAAMLAGQVQQLEMQVGVEKHELNSGSTRVEMLQSQLDEARKALAKYDDGGVGEYVIALKNVPELARQLAHYTREVKLLETISAFLRQQVEQEKIAEQKNLPSLQILDIAEAPLKRSFPRRGQMLILGVIVGFALSNIVVLIVRYAKEVKERPHEHTKILNFTRTLRGGRRAKLVSVHPQATATTSSLEHLHTTERSVGS